MTRFNGVSMPCRAFLFLSREDCERCEDKDRCLSQCPVGHFCFYHSNIWPNGPKKPPSAPTCGGIRPFRAGRQACPAVYPLGSRPPPVGCILPITPRHGKLQVSFSEQLILMSHPPSRSDFWDFGSRISDLGSAVRDPRSAIIQRRFLPRGSIRPPALFPRAPRKRRTGNNTARDPFAGG
jgi:hypothetical protein